MGQWIIKWVQSEFKRVISVIVKVMGLYVTLACAEFMTNITAVRMERSVGKSNE